MPMLGSRVTTRLPWSQCHCGCLAGARSRKAERRAQRSVEKAAWKKEALA
jgi:predicted adenine nucleotide alpha hydrolase (AANH) superfamily ATPase